MQQPDAMIFDLDGTLFQTEKVAIPAFQRIFERLIKKGFYKGDIPDNAAITSVFGMTTAELWEKMLPDSTKEQRDWADDALLEEELLTIEEGFGHLYPSVEETLEYLRSHGISLFVGSNGGEPYVKGVIKAMGIEKMFTHIYSAGEYHTDKKEDLVALILKENSIENAVMVGDRRSDVSAGKANGLYVIGCDFGFARRDELEAADIVIEDFSGVREWLERIR